MRGLGYFLLSGCMSLGSGLHFDFAGDCTGGSCQCAADEALHRSGRLAALC